jgi:hypothetical protein
MTEWKPVKDYEGLYEVSSEGQVRSLPSRVKYVHPNTGKECSRANHGRVLKYSSGGIGYAIVHLCDGERRDTRYVHRIVAEAFLPNPEHKPQVNHIDGDKRNNVLTNLEWATKFENMHHALANGLNRYGKCYEAYATA